MRRIVLILSMTIFLGCSIKDNQNIDHECIFVDLADLKDIKINDLFLIFGISQGIMSFVYHSQIGSSLQYNHTYEKNDISTVHFRIIKEFLDNE